MGTHPIFESDFDCLTVYNEEQIKSGEFFYGLLHRRYVLTTAGLNPLLKNFHEGLYGKCLKLKCNGQNCLPIGSIEVKSSNVQLYCPKCCDIFETEDSNLDGAFFGPNLPHMFMMVKMEKRPVPKVFDPFAFKVTDDDQIIFEHLKKK